MKNNSIIALIRKFLAGRASQAEQRELEEWWDTTTHDPAVVDSISEKDWEKLKAEMGSNIHAIIRSEGQNKKNRTATILLNPAWKVAASIILVMTVALSVYYITKDNIVRTAYGEKRTITLPDQSVVVLNGNSTLRYASGWNENEDRTVWLEGEAFFSVKHTLNHNRFTVHGTNNLTIEVLGTQFNVINRKGKTDVVLQEGSVRLEDLKGTYTMKPNEMVSYSTDKKFVSQKVAALQKVSWKTNLIVYENETVGSILDKLADSHGLRIVFENSDVRNEIFNGSVPSDSVAVFFEKMEKLYRVTVVQNEDGTYVIQ